jgi:hypothetical protein
MTVLGVRHQKQAIEATDRSDAVPLRERVCRCVKQCALQAKDRTKMRTSCGSLARRAAKREENWEEGAIARKFARVAPRARRGGGK